MLQSYVLTTRPIGAPYLPQLFEKIARSKNFELLNFCLITACFRVSHFNLILDSRKESKGWTYKTSPVTVLTSKKLGKTCRGGRAVKGNV